MITRINPPIKNLTNPKSDNISQNWDLRVLGMNGMNQTIQKSDLSTFRQKEQNKLN